jgi:hypothetical protein
VCLSDILTSLFGRPSICSRVASLLVATNWRDSFHALGGSHGSLPRAPSRGQRRTVVCQTGIRAFAGAPAPATDAKLGPSADQNNPANTAQRFEAVRYGSISARSRFRASDESHPSRCSIVSKCSTVV